MKQSSQTGFFLIEVVVAASVIATVLLLLLSSVQRSVDVSARSLERTQVSYLLEEGAEAVKSIRDNGWATITSLNDDVYYLSWSGSAWSLTTTPSTLDSQFTRTVTIVPVSRDSNDDIVTSGGTNDTGTKKVTVAVSWTPSTGARSESMSFYISDIR